MYKHTIIILLSLIAITYMTGPANAQQLIINEFVARNDSEAPLRNGELQASYRSLYFFNKIILIIFQSHNLSW